MLEHILPLIPPHKKYVEPFAGGAAVFFAKPPSPVEVLNDINGNLANFYRVMKLDFEALHRLIDATLHDEHTYKRARDIYRGKVEATDVERAWAVWVAAAMSFGGNFFTHFQITCNAADRSNPGTHTRNKRKEFGQCAKRLEETMILDKDAIIVLHKYNQVDSFAYCDPPYIEVDQGPYCGYTRRQYLQLLCNLSRFKGKFLLSSYDTDLLQWFTKRYGWRQKFIGQRLGVKGTKQRKIEVLTWNYEKELTLF